MTKTVGRGVALLGREATRIFFEIACLMNIFGQAITQDPQSKTCWSLWQVDSDKAARLATSDDLVTDIGERAAGMTAHLERREEALFEHELAVDGRPAAGLRPLVTQKDMNIRH